MTARQTTAVLPTLDVQGVPLTFFVDLGADNSAKVLLANLSTWLDVQDQLHEDPGYYGTHGLVGEDALYAWASDLLHWHLSAQTDVTLRQAALHRVEEHFFAKVGMQQLRPMLQGLSGRSRHAT